MPGYINYFFSSTGQFLAIAATAIVWLGLTAIGDLAAGKYRFREGAFLFGWAVLVLVFTNIGVFAKIPFSWLAMAFAVAAIGAAFMIWRRDGQLIPASFLRTVVFAIPLLVLISGMAASQWDEFSHWLPSLRFLLVTDGFPDAANPRTGATFPAYPYAWPMIGYLVSRVAGQLTENAAPMINVLLLLSFGLLTLRLIDHAGGQNRWRQESFPAGWFLCALGTVAATVINPTFVQKVILTNYADTPSAVALGFAAVISWFMLEAEADGRHKDALSHAWQTGLALVLVVSLKQSTLILFLALAGTILLIGLRDPAIGWKNLAKLFTLVVVPPLIAYAVWRYHVATELPGREFSIRPVSAWAIDLLPTILGSMATVALKKSLYFGIMLIATAFAVRGFVRLKTPFDRLAVIVGAVFAGYNFFLLFAYVTAFTDGEASRAASYWRYNMHLGALCIAFAAYGLTLLWHRHAAPRIEVRRLAWLPVALILAAPFIFAYKLRFDLHPPVPFFRTVGADVAGLLPDGARLIVIDPTGSGESGVITRYEGGGRIAVPVFMSAFSHPTAENIRRTTTSSKADFALVHSVTPAVEEVFDGTLAQGWTHLMQSRDDGGWQILRSWERPKK